MKVTPGQLSWVMERGKPTSRGATAVPATSGDSLPVLDVTFTEVDGAEAGGSSLPVSGSNLGRRVDDSGWKFRPALEYARTADIWGTLVKGAYIDVRA